MTWFGLSPLLSPSTHNTQRHRRLGGAFHTAASKGTPFPSGSGLGPKWSDWSNSIDCRIVGCPLFVDCTLQSLLATHLIEPPDLFFFVYPVLRVSPRLCKAPWSCAECCVVETETASESQGHGRRAPVHQHHYPCSLMFFDQDRT